MNVAGLNRTGLRHGMWELPARGLDHYGVEGGGENKCVTRLMPELTVLEASREHSPLPSVVASHVNTVRCLQ